MATRVPSIHVIRDTPTSPNHHPVLLHTSPSSSPQSSAPEVDTSVRETYEGLQVDPNGPYPQPTTSDTETKHQWWHFGGSSEKQTRHGSDDAGLIPSEHAPAQNRKRKRICGLKRRTFIITAAVVAILVVCAAIGGGVGGALAARHARDDDNNGGYPVVTSGTTGMAALPCRNTSSSSTSTSPNSPAATPRDIANPYLATGATFNITCRRGPPGDGDGDGNSDGNGSGHPIGNLHRYTEYNITACMARCAAEQACKGVVYGANLTAMVADGTPGANCLLKNATWDAVGERAFWVASAVKVGV
ncbi:hypothetical protein K491DRAFT_713271 [Lophiostoma macrostomum CBS 122681]|uniref:Apple domain-containing protein n=1 Tax=Lophiostoma macrostomum CBS 122681 TaxID=1314788 RepID=A0A6A6TFQ0_9PLEO|nr:hypothetical protein K491DRAFT_713271 [Lophiostoma macrostomum CBS 122681]